MRYVALRFLGLLGAAGSACIQVELNSPNGPVAASAPQSAASEEPFLPVRQIHTHASTTCAVFEDGRLKCWGLGSSGQLADNRNNILGDHPNDMGDKLAAVPLSGGAVVAIAGGTRTACAVLSDGRVKCWGSGYSGSLGTGSGSNTLVEAVSAPVIDLGTGKTAKAVVGGRWVFCAHLTDDTVKCWGGDSGVGNLGIGEAGGIGDAPGEMGDALPAVNLGTGRTVKSLSASGLHVCAILDDDTLKCWGFNAYGALGTESTTYHGTTLASMGDALPVVNVGTGRKVKKVGTATWGTCAILDNDRLKCWGYNAGGALGLGFLTPWPDSIGNAPGEMGDSLPYVDLGTGRTVKEVANGAVGACAILDDNGLKCWGAASVAPGGDYPPGAGLLGSGDTVDRGGAAGQMGDNLPYVDLGTGRHAVKVHAHGEGSHFCAILDNGKVKCWGANQNGQLGVGDRADRGDAPGEMGDNLPYVDLGTGRTAKALAPSPDGTCALLDDDTVKCWGSNTYYKTGQSQDYFGRGGHPGDMGGNLPFIDVGGPVRSVATGSRSVCVLLESEDVKCWGYNFYGTLGLGNQTDWLSTDGLPAVDLGSGRKAKLLRSGFYGSCALLDNNTVKCWGYNTYGSAGQGSTSHVGDAPGELGDALPPVDLGTSATILDLQVGGYHACVLFQGGQVKCWGYGFHGQLGHGATTNLGDAPGEMGASLPYVSFGAGRTVTRLRAHSYLTCAQLDNGAVKCFGANLAEYGSLGLGDTNNRGDGPNEMGDDLPAIDFGTTLALVDIRPGLSNCAIFEGGRVKCMGRNANGQLGLGDQVNRGDTAGSVWTTIPFLDLGSGFRAVEVVGGTQHVCARSDAGRVKCWGGGASNQLGIESLSDRGDAPGELGDGLPYVNLGL
jgi:alpha-tubulin suppressor-like RCC1 family protein